MQMVRTTLRLKAHLKKSAERKALEEESTFQSIMNQALEEYLAKSAAKEAKKIVFKTHDLGTPLDNLKRRDYYGKI